MEKKKYQPWNRRQQQDTGMISKDRKDGACKSISHTHIPEYKKYVKYGKYAQYAQYARHLPACHQSRHANNVERHIHNM